MKPRMHIAVSVVATLLAVGEGHSQPSPLSPEEVFDAAAQAWRKQGLKGVMPHLTKDSQQLVAGTVVCIAACVFEDSGDGTADGRLLDKLLALVRKHGASDDDLRLARPILTNDARDRTNKELRDILLRLGAPLKEWDVLADRAFHICKEIKELLGLPLAPGHSFIVFTAPSRLTRVYAGDETAQGIVVSRRGATEKTSHVYFRKEDGQWKIDLLKQVDERGLAD